MTGKFIDRKALLSKVALKIEKVDFGNGEFVYVKEMTGHERDTMEASFLKPIKKDGKVVDFETTQEDFRSKMAVLTVCDADGNLILQPNDWRELSKSISASKLIKIADAAAKLNAITPEDAEELSKG